MKRVNIYSISISIAVFCLLHINLNAQDTEIKLPTDDNTSSFNVTDSNNDNILKVRGDGKVGIGTSSPSGKLHVEHDGRYAGYFTSNYEPFLGGNDARVIYSEYTGTTHLDAAAVCGISDPADYWGIGGIFIGGYRGVAGEVYSTGSSYYRGVYGRASGGSGNNCGVYGYAYGDGTNYAVYADGNLHYTGNLTGPSDEKFNRDLKNIDGILPRLMQIEPKTFQFTNNSEYEHMNFSEGNHYGVTAQNLETIFPELVVDEVNPPKEKDGEPIKYKGVNYIELIPIVIQAIKEQQKQIEELQTALKTK